MENSLFRYKHSLTDYGMEEAEIDQLLGREFGSTDAEKAFLEKIMEVAFGWFQ